MNAALDLALATDPGNEQPIIRTERLVLRPLRRSDVGLIEHYTADRRLAEGTRTIPNPLPPGATEAWVIRAMAASADPDGAHVWAIDGTDAGLAEVLGTVSLHRVAPEQCELEFWIGHGLWNTGFATEAVAGLLAANPCKCRSFVAETFQDNPGSARVLTNCGFDYLGDAESWSVARNMRVPTWTYARPVG
ncbi:N-acetyltransferase [Paracoccus suum]|uniref:N-acetyltransferase n=1 Tax=Paracoccus suum TaxID=2259340 RepID=A0A344PJ77_9RHOB|nr:GNAT family N-acetyltransferase [Paracoccus suum]AXC49432.1 N-acetyltransferase [Paracoccus suum]